MLNGKINLSKPFLILNCNCSIPTLILGVFMYFENLKRFTLILATFMLKKTITMVPWPLSVGCYRVILKP